MQKQFALLALACASVACQPQTASTTVTAQDAQGAVASLLAGSAATGAPHAATATLTDSMRAILRRCDLAALWSNPHGTYQESPVLDGFVGTEHQRFALAINTVHQDARQPQLFRVNGKSRLKGVTIPFSGTITIVSITSLADDMVAPGEAADSTNSLYTAKGLFQFQQTAKISSDLAGEVFFDFVLDKQGRVDMVTTIMTNPDDKFPAKGCGMVLRGQYTSRATGKQKELLLARDVFVIAPEVFADFGVGDRGTLVNPKYAKLGWNEAWENEEWWADSPKPGLNM